MTSLFKAVEGIRKEIEEYRIVAHAKTITEEDKNYWEGRRIGLVIAERIIDEQLSLLPDGAKTEEELLSVAHYAMYAYNAPKCPPPLDPIVKDIIQHTIRALRDAGVLYVREGE